MGGLRNPIFQKGAKEIYRFIDNPSSANRIRFLEAELEKARNKEPEVREVVREVVKEDTSLLQKYNETLRELGNLKRDIAKGSPHLKATVQAMQEPAVQIRTVEKEVFRDVVRIQRVHSKRQAVIAAVLALAIGLAGGYSMRPAEQTVLMELKAPKTAPKRR